MHRPLTADERASLTPIPHRPLTRQRLHQIGITGLKADLILSLGQLRRSQISRTQRDLLAETTDRRRAASHRRIAMMSRRIAGERRLAAQRGRNSGATRLWKRYARQDLIEAADHEHKARLFGIRLP